MTTDEQMPEQIRRSMGQEPLVLMLQAAEAAPRECREWPPERVFQYVRCRLRFTQAELASKSGLTQSQVSRVESGADCRLGTWMRVYAAMGFELRLLPSSSMGLTELEGRAEEGRPQGHWMRQRSRPRRVWRDGRMITLSGGRPPSQKETRAGDAGAGRGEGLSAVTP